MPVRFFYVDESYDADVFCLSAIAVRHSTWKECFEKVRTHRKQLHQDYGIKLSKELHARDLVAGRGAISDRVIGKWQRSRIYYRALELIASLPDIFVMNIALERRGCKDAQIKAWDRLLNRVERTMKEFETRELGTRASLLHKIKDQVTSDTFSNIQLRLNNYRSRAFIISDEGRELEIIRAVRKMHVHNPIPSAFGEWSPGTDYKNIVTERVIEDPMFKESGRSYFVQLADFVAFALLKRETTLRGNVKKYGIHEMFDKTIAKVCYVKASRSDPLGIVRN